MSPSDPRLLLARWLEGDLDAAQEERLHAALEHDAALRGEAAGQARVLALLLAAAGAERGPATAAAVMAQIAAQRDSGAMRTLAGVDGRLRRRRLARRLAIAALLVVGLAGIALLLRPAPQAWLEVVASEGAEAVDTAGQRRTLRPGMRLAAGESLRAGGDPAAIALRLAGRGARLVLAGGARLQLPAQRADGDLELRLDGGAIACDGTALTAGGHHLRLTTPHATIVTEGTRFDCLVEADATRVRLAEGAVRVQALDQAVRLAAGEQTTVAAGGVPAPPTAAASAGMWDGADAWTPRPPPIPPWRYVPGDPGVTPHAEAVDGETLTAMPAEGTPTFNPERYVAISASRADAVMLTLTPDAVLRFRIRCASPGMVMATVTMPGLRLGSEPAWASSPHVTISAEGWQEVAMPLRAFWSGVPGHDWSRQGIDSIAVWGFGIGPFAIAGLRVE